MKTIITIQHTESVHHTNGMIGSWTDWDLTEKGKTEAKTIADTLTKEIDLTGFDLYSSDLKRAIQTAEPLAEILKITIQKDKRLRERNLGEACGKSVNWLKDNIIKHEETVEDRLFPSTESKRESWERLSPFYNEIIEKGDALIVAHGDILTQFHSMFLGYEVEHLDQLTFSGKTGGVSQITIMDSEKVVINKINDGSYKKN